jgi:hypothetical protein
MAPLLSQDWIGQLSALKPNWDSYGGSPITEAALATVGSISVVPCSSGGIQLETHRDGFDIEIEIGPDGYIISAISVESSHCARRADADTARLEYFFSPGCKLDINGYMQGVREGWTVDQWREYIDAAMKAQL